MSARTVLMRYRVVLSVSANLALAGAAYLCAFALRFDLPIPGPFLAIALATLPLLLACKAAGFWLAGLFSGWWRHVTVRDAEAIVRGNVIATILFLAVMFVVGGLDGFPRSVFLLDLLLSIAFVGGLRVAVRLAREHEWHPSARRIDALVLIVGAGSSGIRLIEEIERHRRLTLAVVGFVDDDPSKKGMRICGCPVLGGIDDISALVSRHDVGEVLIALPSATGALLRRIVQRCSEARVRHRVLPTLGELVEGRVSYTQMREVKVEDLLARAPIHLDVPRVRSFVTGRTVLVSGAAGSIGSELCRQLASYQPERLVLYDRHENGIFCLEMELRARFPKLATVPVLGDILLEDQLNTVFAGNRPEIVFHAAAYKHVPLAEHNVIEAARNNVIGTRNLALAAISHGAAEFVLVSTDKAVRPTSVMGATKRVAEMVVQSLQNGHCRFGAVRFGNVLGSSGSVVPLFREQIARGGPVTVTHPQVTRYFMIIPEAVHLILQAATLGNGAEIFILEMGEPVLIADLARQMIRLSGYEPDEDIPIVYTGLRPGEKLHEELMADEEELDTTYHDRIKILRAATPRVSVHAWLPELHSAILRADVRATLGLLQRLVPDYRPSGVALTMAGEALRSGQAQIAAQTNAA
jgi:FlaA1/EpsC-like NDP-sugar epimerase